MEQYSVFELVFYKDITLENEAAIDLHATFKLGNEVTNVKGFYAGNSTFKIRFLPTQVGIYSYVVSGLIESEGSVDVSEANAKHGMLTANGNHVKFSDGTRFDSFGTTVYALAYQPKELIEQTLDTLKSSPFNKIRTCVFPKYYQYNRNEPEFYPFEKLVKQEYDGSVVKYMWDVKKPNYAFWDHFENVLNCLNELEMIVDLILFHPYDRWGLSAMSREESIIYLDYVMRRLSSYPNIMWSMANEFDLIQKRTEEDWFAFEDFIVKNDPYSHMISNHNCFVLYDYSRSNISHVSIQTRDPSRVPVLMKYGKPVFVDECAYEGNLQETFGCLTGQEMVDRFWKITVTGGYATHGETFVDYDADLDDQVVFWSKGGVLKGESPERIAFLRRFIEGLPGPIDFDPGSGFNPLMYMDKKQLEDLIQMVPSEHATTLAAICNMGDEEKLYHLTTESEFNGRVRDDVFIHYYGKDVHGMISLNLPEGNTYRIEAIDTWNMTRETISEHECGECELRFPEKQWMAVAAFVN